MRTTINLDDELIAKAQVCTGIKEKTRLIHLGLEALIQRDASLRLAALGGTAPGAQAGRRKRSARAEDGAAGRRGGGAASKK